MHEINLNDVDLMEWGIETLHLFCSRYLRQGGLSVCLLIETRSQTLKPWLAWNSWLTPSWPPRCWDSRQEAPCPVFLQVHAREDLLLNTSLPVPLE